MDGTLAIILIVVGVLVGVALGFFGGMTYRKKVAEREIGSAEKAESDSYTVGRFYDVYILYASF